MAGLNEYEHSFRFSDDNKVYWVYHTRYRRIDIAIIEAQGLRAKKDGYKRKEWFFGTFRGNHEEYDMTLSSEDIEKIKSLVHRRNRVAGADLDCIVRSIIEEI